MHGQIISLPNGFLRDITLEDVSFINDLFNEPDVDFFYVRQSYHRTAFAFTSFLVSSLEHGRGLADIIIDDEREPIGLITAEIVLDNTERIRWNIGYAVNSRNRHKGYASSSLAEYMRALSDFSINTACLDISIDNEASEAVAKKCGFEIRDRCGFLDKEHPEVGLRRHWFKSIHAQDARIPCFQRASIAYRNKDYLTAIRLYMEALKIPQTEGSQLTDAQIYSNLGMAHSSIGEYQKAYSYLRKATSLGLMNASIQKELAWLRNNAGIG